MSLHGRRATSDDAQQTKLSVPHATRRIATVPQPSKHQTSRANAKSVSRNRMSAGSSSSTELKFANSGDDSPRVEKETRRPSNLPRSTSSHSSARLEAIATSRHLPASATVSRPRPDVSASSIGLFEKDRMTNMLRRKTPSIEQYVARDSQASNARRAPPSSHSSHFGSGQDLETDAIFGIAFPDLQKHPTTNLSIPAMYSRTRPAELPPSLIPELQALAVSSELSRPQGFSTAPFMSSPSSIYSDSPEPWSSRGTTPTSMSSYSPGVIQTFKHNPPARRLNSTLSQPREMKSRPGEPQWTEVSKLPAVQEATLPSSSGSRDKNPVTPKAKPEKLKKKKTPSPAPKPPPRKSSVKFKPPKAGEGEPGSAQQTVAAERVETYENPPDSPLQERNARTIDYVGQSLEGSSSYVPTQSELPFPAKSFLKPRQGETSQAGLRAFPTISNDSGDFSNRGMRIGKSEQPLVSYDQQQPKNSILAQKADQRRAQSAPRATLANTSRNLPTGQKQPTASNTAESTSGRSKNAHPTSPEESDRDIRSTPRSGLSKLSTFFSRRARSASAEAVKDNTGRSSHKGPAAGTGHEGYRKHGFRSRKMSSESTASSDTRSLNQGSIAPRSSTSRKDSGSSHRNSRSSREDPAAEQFVAQRLEPVVILGGGGYRNRPKMDAPAPWPTPNDGLVVNRAGHDVWVQRTGEAVPADANRTPPLFQISADRDEAVLSRSSGANLSSTPRTTAELSLAARRSFSSAQVYDEDNSAVQIPTPNKIEGLAIYPVPDSCTTSQSSLPQTASNLPVIENEMHKVDAKYLKKTQQERAKHEMELLPEGPKLGQGRQSYGARNSESNGSAGDNQQ